MDSTSIGATADHRLVVTTEIAVDFLGMEEARVLGTPYLIGFLEMTSRNLLKPFLAPGQDSVGTLVNIRHIAATPIGMQVTFHSELISWDDRRVLFRVEAVDEKEKICEGTHERYVIDVARFVTRLEAKRQK